MTERKPGEAMPTEALQQLDEATLINRILMFIRSDFGGAEHKHRVALKRALETTPALEGILFKLEPDQQRTLADALISVAEHTAEGSRKRVKSTVEELRRRHVGEKEQIPPTTAIKI